LQQLSQYVNFTASQQPDGAVTVLLNGQVPLLMGAQAFSIQNQPVAADSTSANPNAPPTMTILASDGSDITSQLTGGTLGALMNLANTVFPEYLGSGGSAGEINTMAQQFADTVNQALTSGNVSDGPPPVAGVPLFTYDTTNATNVAQTLAVDPTVTAGQLAAISAGPPRFRTAFRWPCRGWPSPVRQRLRNRRRQLYRFLWQHGGGHWQRPERRQQQPTGTAIGAGPGAEPAATGFGSVARCRGCRFASVPTAYEANSKLITILDQLSEDTINMLVATS